MEYNLTREQAAQILWISTRTLDRRIRKGIFTYEKRSNKVYLSEEEVKNYNQHKNISNVVYEATTGTTSETSTSLSALNTEELVAKISTQFEKNMDKFIEMLKEKDKKLEEKTQMILVLQHKVSELENKLKHTVALPLYEEEKKELILEKENLKIENKFLAEKLKKEKIKNIALITLIVVIVLILLLVLAR